MLSTSLAPGWADLAAAWVQPQLVCDRYFIHVHPLGVVHACKICCLSSGRAFVSARSVASLMNSHRILRETRRALSESMRWMCGSMWFQSFHCIPYGLRVFKFAAPKPKQNKKNDENLKCWFCWANRCVAKICSFHFTERGIWGVFEDKPCLNNISVVTVDWHWPTKLWKQCWE